MRDLFVWDRRRSRQLTGKRTQTAAQNDGRLDRLRVLRLDEIGRLRSLLKTHKNRMKQINTVE